MHDPIFDIFQEEVREHLKGLEESFLDLESTTDPQVRADLVSKMFRHAHNIKGDSRALDILPLQQAAGVLEETLERLRKNPSAASQSIIDAGLAELDQLRNKFKAWHLEFTRSRRWPEEAHHEMPSESPAVLDSTSDTATASHWGEATASVRVSADRLDRMLNLVGEVRVLQRSEHEMQQQLKDLRSRFDELATHFEGEQRAALEAAFDHVRRIETSLRQQQTREHVLMQSLEEDISAARLLPLSMLADSLRRPVRDLARSLNKQVQYQVDVGEVLLDKAVIESLRTPLLHLIRNAVDHGIEAPQLRSRAGKSPTAIVRLEAKRRGEKVFIRVSDDGSGPDFEKIRQRVVTFNLLKESEAEQLTHEQLAYWLFHPGVTTSAVGEISGRGVGLDAVRDALQRIQGKIEISFQPGQGTTFVLTLPVTISTLHVLTAWCGGQCFGFPSEEVLKAGRVKSREVRQLKGTPVISIDGEPVHWVSLADMLKLEPIRREAENESLPYVMIYQGGKPLAIHVDDVDDEREVLLKPLEFPLSNLPGILGGTIRPDGSVQLVFDFNTEFFLQAATTPQQERIQISGRTPRILVVDDSPTTRAMLRNLFTAAGYFVETAVDGIDALGKLQYQRSDVVVCDFEMPRLNGVDLTRQIKSKWKLPVILVTGREKDHHRREGLEAGADAYLVKSSFRGDSLLDVVRQFVSW